MQEPSINVFREFIIRRGDGTLDASRILSPECFHNWQHTRKKLPANPAKSFQRTLSAHITGIDNRAPFTEVEEQAVLAEVRQKTRWPCFAHLPTKMGEMGFRAKGFHEKRAALAQEEKQDGSSNSGGEDEENGATSQEYNNSSGKDDMDEEEEGIAGAPLPQPPVTRIAMAERFLELSRTAMDHVPSGDENEMLEKLYGICRMLLVSLGVFSRPTVDEAQIFLKRIQQDYPAAEDDDDSRLSFVVMDCTCHMFAQRFLLQSVNTVPCVGHITREYGGFNGPLIDFASMWTVMGTMTKSLIAPNVFHGPVPCKLTGLGAREYSVNMVFIMDPALLMLGVVIQCATTTMRN